MKPFLFIVAIALFFSCSYAQQQTFDIITFTPPKGWTKSEKDKTLSFSIEKGNAFCVITLYKALDATLNAQQNFDLAWQSLVQENLGVTTKAQMQPGATDQGWETKMGSASFEKDGIKGAAILVSSSQAGKMVNLMALANSTDFQSEMESFISSISLKKPVAQNTATKQPSVPKANGRFKFNITNFENGWTSVEKEDWVEVSKNSVKVLIHYPKEGTVFPADPAPMTNKAWDILVAPRYSNLKNYKTAYITSYIRQYFGMAHLTDNETSKSVFVVIFKSDGGWIECVTPDKNTFIQEFKFDPEAVDHNSEISISKPLELMAQYNRFAIAATDLDNTGTWSDRFSSNTFYADYYTGAYAGMSTYSSAQSFLFGPAQSYHWELAASNSALGRTKFVKVTGKGKFKLVNQWKIHFPDMEGKPRTYDAYFSCIKGGRVLWLNDAEAPGSGIFTGFTLSANKSANK
mgnify:CR=1 FL=1